ncbi:tail fiber assembly protein [Yokenella regensburgei]|uniref:tail fiber assembly protein n=1 Tax=Yokenella regensburgei TaxID=158877 RepID=UPI001375D3EE|nr:tail fiber assembly protein [Yokenella regensburgei]KAF1367182.1 hypothetical protein FHR25_004397 [Yokenella regensburgei]
MNEKYFYSATRRGFYLQSMKDAYEKSTNGWPDNAVEISSTEYSALLKGQEEGKEITPNTSGKPVLTEPKIDPREVAESTKRQLMERAEQVITQLERAIKLDMATAEEKTRLTEWEKYSVLLNRINPGDAPKIDWPPKPE